MRIAPMIGDLHKLSDGRIGYVRGLHRNDEDVPCAIFEFLAESGALVGKASIPIEQIEPCTARGAA